MSEPPRPVITLDDVREMDRRLRADAMRGGLPPSGLAVSGRPPGVEFEEQVDRVLAILDAMTPSERREPASIGPEACRRIAAEAEVDPAEVDGLVEQHAAMTAKLDRRPAAAAPLAVLLDRDLRLWDFTIEDERTDHRTTAGRATRAKRRAAGLFRRDGSPRPSNRPPNERVCADLDSIGIGRGAAEGSGTGPAPSPKRRGVPESLVEHASEPRFPPPGVTEWSASA